MEKILGLDLGTNSIGWAIREINPEVENQIIDKGVLTFEKGVAEDKSGEHPKVQKRTESRAKRRNYQAEKYRKWELLECLIENKMCPLTIDELNDWRHYKKDRGRKYPQSEQFIQWLRFDFDGDGKPDFERLGYSKHESYYLFRSLIVDESKKQIFTNEQFVIGRVLYQLVQRRGYFDLSDEELDEKEKNELSNTIKKGGGENGPAGADEITPYLEKYKTLGAALYHLQREKGVRIRKRYNLRSHFENELKEICRVHNLEHLYNKFWSAIIWQRPLRSQKGLVGICTYEKNKPRCPISHPLYEEYRTWVFINNLKIRPVLPPENDKRGKEELERILNEVVYPLFYRSSDFKLTVIEKELKKHSYKIGAKFPDDTKALSCSFLYTMQQLFEEDWMEQLGWNELLNNEPKPDRCKYNIEDLWHWHFTKSSNKKTGQEPFEILKGFAQQKLSLPKDKAERFAKIRLQQGYATLSVNAIKKILPYLKKGFIYSEAIYLANLPKVMGNKKLNEGDIENFAETIHEIIKLHRYEQRVAGVYNNLVTDYFEDKNLFEVNKADLIESYLKENYGEKTWNSFSAETQSNIITDVETKLYAFLYAPKQKPENHYLKAGRLHDKIFMELMNDYSLPAENIKHLWHPSEQETYPPALQKNGKKYLGSPEPISKGFKNPMALKTLHKLKRLVNYLIEAGKIDEQTRVVVETARELNNANMRKAIERWQRDREKENESFKKKLEEINAECKTNYDVNDKNLIGKIRLWSEQKHLCVYTGKTINLCDLLDGSKYDYEHTVPASMSFDNELKNLTIADKTYNQQIKGKRLPTECPNFENEYNGCPAIIDTLQTMFGRITKEEKKVKGKAITTYKCERIEELQMKYDRYLYFAKIAQTKENKDKNIIEGHITKMELDYWRYKFQTFTIKEYKAGWRNSQLRDTQTITKYALPYLRTVFENVEAQKGSVTSDFRKIFKIQPRKEKKDRSTHAHHAMDAAVLTLIPPSVIRDKFLKEFNEAVDNNIEHSYHRNPLHWSKFHANYVLGIENDVLINFQPEFRTLTPTYKQVRKRGKVQYIRFKDKIGKWHFKLDTNGNKIPWIAKGDTIRGQLHEESFMTLIKQAEYRVEGEKYIPITDGKGNFIFQKKNNEDELFVVKKIQLTELDSLEKFKKIVDPNLRSYLTQIIQSKMEMGKPFSQAILEPIWAFGKKVDKKGNPISPLRHIRCRVSKAAGFLSKEKTLDIRPNQFRSKFAHKRNVLAGNDEMIVCLLYVKHQLKCFRLMSRFELANLKIKDTKYLFGINEYNTILKGAKKVELPLYHIIVPGTKVLLLDETVKTIEGLKEIEHWQLLKRLFVVNNFNIPAANTIYIYLINHLDARPKEALQKDEEKNIDISKYQAKLVLTADKFECAIQGKHFVINPDGEIKWLL